MYIIDYWCWLWFKGVEGVYFVIILNCVFGVIVCVCVCVHFHLCVDKQCVSVFVCVCVSGECVDRERIVSSKSTAFL